MSLTGALAVQGCGPVPRQGEAAGSPRGGEATAGQGRPSGASTGGCDEPVTLPPQAPPDWARLERGERVEVPVRFARCGDEYVGGVAYIVVNAAPGYVYSKLNRLENLARIIRGTRKMTVTDRSLAGVTVLLEQGNSVVSASYSATFRQRTAEIVTGEWEVRFWLDPSRPHAIDDVWGFFRAGPWESGGTLVSVGAAVNLGPGLIRMLFEDHVQKSILRMPRYVRQVVEGR